MLEIITVTLNTKIGYKKCLSLLDLIPRFLSDCITMTLCVECIRTKLYQSWLSIATFDFQVYSYTSWSVTLSGCALRQSPISAHSRWPA